MKTNYKNIIESKLNAINGALGTDYTANYNSYYGGWAMYEHGTHEASTLGFDLRKSNAEFLAYLNGIQHALYHLEIAKGIKVK